MNHEYHNLQTISSLPLSFISHPFSPPPPALPPACTQGLVMLGRCYSTGLPPFSPNIISVHNSIVPQ